MKLPALMALLCAFTTTQAFASAKVLYSPRSYTLKVSAHIYFYGVGANDAVVKAATDEINLYWNGGSHLNSLFQTLSTQVGGSTEHFVMNVTSEIVTPAQAARLIKSNPSPEMNFIQILPGDASAGDRSFMDEICGNTGTWYVSDDLGKSTTAAHEFGHGLCLEHPDLTDWRGKGQPPIMAPRGTIVDAIYQWDPTAAAGAYAGSLSPYKRLVMQFDIDEIKLGSRKFDENGVLYLSAASSILKNGKVDLSKRVY